MEKNQENEILKENIKVNDKAAILPAKRNSKNKIN